MRKAHEHALVALEIRHQVTVRVQGRGQSGERNINWLDRPGPCRRDDACHDLSLAIVLFDDTGDPHEVSRIYGGLRIAAIEHEDTIGCLGVVIVRLLNIETTKVASGIGIVILKIAADDALYGHGLSAHRTRGSAALNLGYWRVMRIFFD